MFVPVSVSDSAAASVCLSTSPPISPPSSTTGSTKLVRQSATLPWRPKRAKHVSERTWKGKTWMSTLAQCDTTYQPFQSQETFLFVWCDIDRCGVIQAEYPLPPLRIVCRHYSNICFLSRNECGPEEGTPTTCPAEDVDDFRISNPILVIVDLHGCPRLVFWFYHRLDQKQCRACEETRCTTQH